jgi:hydroxyethylthiazole kinase-like uncharacterized protein yjeF
MLVTTAETMRELDRRAIEEIGISGIVLMENAGRGCAEAIRRHYGPFGRKPVIILSGRGNNGGDGMVIARYFHQWGVPVKVYLLSEIEKITGDARTNLNICLNAGVPLEVIPQWEAFCSRMAEIASAHLLVDAILGTGLAKEVKGFYRQVVEFLNQRSVPLVAVDIPSGVDASTGRILGAAVRSDLTLTLALPKVGLLIYPGADFAGRMEVVDIGFPPVLTREQFPCIRLLEPEKLGRLLQPRRADSHKGNYGHLLIVAGSPGKTGAAALAGMGALHMGTGLVTIGIPRSLNPIMEVKLTEVMTEPLPETDQVTFSMASLETILRLLEGKDALALGPGLSRHPETAEMARQLIRQCPVPCVVDADGVNAMAGRLDVLKERPGGPLALTPHPGEMARLVGCSTAAVQQDRLGMARRFAEEYQVPLVLKGARTLVARPDGSVSINPTGNPGMASGGMGDVLTGMIGALLAQGLPMGDALELGVYLHGLAGDRVAAEKGAVGMAAGDLLDHLPVLIRELSGKADTGKPA